MGTTCSCGSSRPCGAGAAGGGDGPAAPAEYEPQRGAAAEEDEDLRNNGTMAAFNKELESNGGPGGPSSPQALSPIAPPAWENRPLAQQLAGQELGELSPVTQAAGAKAAALAELLAALEKAPSPSAAGELELALQRAEQASVHEHELREAKRRLEALRVVQRMHQAAEDKDVNALNDALAKAVDLGVPEAEITRAMSVLARVEEEAKKREETAKAEEQARRKKEAAKDALGKAVASKDPAQLSAAVEDAAAGGALKASELMPFREVLADLDAARVAKPASSAKAAAKGAAKAAAKAAAAKSAAAKDGAAAPAAAEKRGGFFGRRK